MITKQKIEIYLYYKDSDHFARVAKKEEKDLFNDNDWLLIDNLIQDIHLMNSNLASSKTREKIESRINGYTEGENELIQKLLSIK